MQHQRQLSLGSTLPMMQSVQTWGGCPFPLVVESYGAWGKEAQQSFSKLASRLAVHGCVPKSMTTFEQYARLNIFLVRANSRAMLSRS